MRYRADGSPQALQKTCEAIRTRLNRVGIPGVRVLTPEPGRIVVEIPAKERKQVAAVKRLCGSHGGSLSFHIAEELDTRSAQPQCVVLDRTQIERLARLPGSGGEAKDRGQGAGDSESAPDREARLERIRAELERLEKEERFLGIDEKRPGLALDELGVLFCPELRRKETTGEIERDPETGKEIVKSWCVLHNDAGRKIDASRVAEVAYQTGTGDVRPGLSVRFDVEGAARLKELTRSNKGRSLAAVLDGVVLVVAKIHDEIKDGRASLMPGAVPEWEVREWCVTLNAGPLPCALVLESEELIPEANPR